MYRTLMGFTLLALVVGQAAGYSVTVRTYPTNAELYTPGGSYIGLTPCTLGGLTDSYTVDIVKYGYDTFEYTLTPAMDGRVTTLTLTPNTSYANDDYVPNYGNWYSVPSYAGWCWFGYQPFWGSAYWYQFSRDGRFGFGRRNHESPYAFRDFGRESQGFGRSGVNFGRRGAFEARAIPSVTAGAQYNVNATLGRARAFSPTSRLQWQSRTEVAPRGSAAPFNPVTVPTIRYRAGTATPGAQPRVGIRSGPAPVRAPTTFARPATSRLAPASSGARTMPSGMRSFSAPAAAPRMAAPRGFGAQPAPRR